MDIKTDVFLANVDRINIDKIKTHYSWCVSIDYKLRLFFENFEDLHTFVSKLNNVVKAEEMTMIKIGDDCDGEI